MFDDNNNILCSHGSNFTTTTFIDNTLSIVKSNKCKTPVHDMKTMGRMLITTGNEGPRVWSAKTGKEILNLQKSNSKPIHKCNSYLILINIYTNTNIYTL